MDLLPTPRALEHIGKIPEAMIFIDTKTVPTYSFLY